MKPYSGRVHVWVVDWWGCWLWASCARDERAWHPPAMKLVKVIPLLKHLSPLGPFFIHDCENNSTILTFRSLGIWCILSKILLARRHVCEYDTFFCRAEDELQPAKGFIQQQWANSINYGALHIGCLHIFFLQTDTKDSRQRNRSQMTKIQQSLLKILNIIAAVTRTSLCFIGLFIPFIEHHNIRNLFDNL